jgi:hypothetical protein
MSTIDLAMMETVVGGPPCAYCSITDPDRAHVVGPRSVFRACTACGYARYCNPACQRTHWVHSTKSHRALCVRLRQGGEKPMVASLRAAFVGAGLFTADGVRWSAVPMTPTPKMAEVLKKVKHNPAVADDLKRYLGSRLQQETVANGVPRTYTTSLVQPQLRVIEVHPALLQPGDAPHIVRAAAARGITRFVDPAAGAGLVGATLRFFGNLDADALRLSDFNPDRIAPEAVVWPGGIPRHDPLDPTTYDGVDWSSTAAVVAWDALPNAVAGTNLVALLHNVGAMHLLVFRARGAGASNTAACSAALVGRYRRDTTVDMDSTVVNDFDVRAAMAVAGASTDDVAAVSNRDAEAARHDTIACEWWSCDW